MSKDSVKETTITSTEAAVAPPNPKKRKAEGASLTTKSKPKNSDPPTAPSPAPSASTSTSETAKSKTPPYPDSQTSQTSQTHSSLPPLHPPPPTSPPQHPPTSSLPPTNPYSTIRHVIVQNDGTHSNLVRLVGLKSLFAKQLPKMPKDYIVRLVFDRRHKSLAVLSDDPCHRGGDDEIIGGICYRPYAEMRFAEIAFCAVNGSHQVKGYGTKLMNLLKRHAVTEGIDYFITYADNYAIGYFKKQGFTKAITMPKSRYHGLIKDYDGANVMECYVHPSVDYTRIPEMVKAQREFVLERIRCVSKSDRVVYPPLEKGWHEKHRNPATDDPADNAVALLRSRSANANEPSPASVASALRAYSVPGIPQAGWHLSDLLSSTKAAKDSDQQKNHLKSELLSLVRKTEDQHFAWPFREPVDTSEVKDYLDIIDEPIDLSTIEKRIEKGDWYKSKGMLRGDLMRMVENCKLFNDSSSLYYECAVSLEKYLDTIFPDSQ